MSEDNQTPKQIKPYCGIGKTKKGQKLGTMKECAEQNQVRLFGINKIDKRTLEAVKKDSNIPESRDALIIKLAGLKGELKRHKGRYETTKDDKIKEESFKIWKKAEKMIPDVEAKLRKVLMGIRATPKATPKKATPKKDVKPKATPKKATPKKATPKKATPKKATPKMAEKEKNDIQEARVLLYGKRPGTKRKTMNTNMNKNNVLDPLISTIETMLTESEYKKIKDKTNDIFEAVKKLLTTLKENNTHAKDDRVLKIYHKMKYNELWKTIREKTTRKHPNQTILSMIDDIRDILKSQNIDTKKP
jgi:hypothetical protein